MADDTRHLVDFSLGRLDHPHMTDTVAAPPAPLVVASDREMPETTKGRKVVALVTVCASLMVITLDVTILNVALPTLALELRASNSALQRPIEARRLPPRPCLITDVPLGRLVDPVPRVGVGNLRCVRPHIRCVLGVGRGLGK
jgi:hypothetical protein